MKTGWRRAAADLGWLALHSFALLRAWFDEVLPWTFIPGRPGIDDFETLWPRIQVNPMWAWKLGTPTDPDSIVMRAKRWGWATLEVPIEHLDEAGERQPSWVGRDTLESIDAMKDEYLRAGNSQAWDQEYMLRPVSEGTRVFRQEMFRVEPRVRRWEATYAMVDPARTVRASSATTGWAAGRSCPIAGRPVPSRW